MEEFRPRIITPTDNRPLVTIHHDGRVDIHDESRLNDAARRFWEAVHGIELVPKADYDRVVQELEDVRQEQLEQHLYRE